MGWSPPQSQSNTKLHGILGLQKVLILLFANMFVEKEQRSLISALNSLAPSCPWFHMGSTIDQEHLSNKVDVVLQMIHIFQSLLLISKTFTSVVGFLDTKHSGLPLERTPSKLQDCTNKNPNHSKTTQYIQIYFPNLSNVSSLHLLWATADSHKNLWWPILPSFNLAKVWDFHPLQNPESPDIPRPKERQKKSETSFVLGQRCQVTGSQLSIIISHSWKLLRPGKLTASALSFWCF